MVLDHLFVGCMAGVVSRTCTAPLELYKIQKQNRFIPYSTPLEVLQKEGIRGLWKGNMTNCIRIGPQTAVNFTVFHWSRRTIWEPMFSAEHKKAIHMCSGGLSGAISTICVYPLETVRTRLALQTNNNHYRNITDVFRKMRLSDMYGGMHVGLIGFVPYNALSFMFYHTYKDVFVDVFMHLWRKDIGNDDKTINSLSPFLIHILSGGLSGMSAVSITYPTDLIRRRLQLKGFDSSVPTYHGMMDCIRKIYASEGVKGFYRGLGICYVKLFPSMAIQFSVMEYSKAWFQIQ